VSANSLLLPQQHHYITSYLAHHLVHVAREREAMVLLLTDVRLTLAARWDAELELVHDPVQLSTTRLAAAASDLLPFVFQWM